MLKRTLIATLAVFIAWQALDFVIHGLILMKAYQTTSPLWRLMPEMKRGLMMVVGLIASFTFTWVYARYVSRKCLLRGLGYGFWFGLGAGVSMGYGTFAVMPIPYYMAFTWFAGTVVKACVAGLIVGALLKDNG